MQWQDAASHTGVGHWFMPRFTNTLRESNAPQQRRFSSLLCHNFSTSSPSQWRVLPVKSTTQRRREERGNKQAQSCQDSPWTRRPRWRWRTLGWTCPGRTEPAERSCPRRCLPPGPSAERDVHRQRQAHVPRLQCLPEARPRVGPLPRCRVMEMGSTAPGKAPGLTSLPDIHLCLTVRITFPSAGENTDHSCSGSAETLLFSATFCANSWNLKSIFLKKAAAAHRCLWFSMIPQQPLKKWIYNITALKHQL